MSQPQNLRINLMKGKLSGLLVESDLLDGDKPLIDGLKSRLRECSIYLDKLKKEGNKKDGV